MIPSPPPGPDLPPPPPGAPADELALATWTFWEALVVALAGWLVANLVVGAFLAITHQTLRAGEPSSSPVDFLSLILFELTWLAVVLLWLRSRHPTWRAVIGIKPRVDAWRDVGAGIAGGVGIRFGVGAVIAVLIEILRPLFGHDLTLAEQVSTDLSAAATITFALAAVVIAPIVEEFVFRGCIFRALRARRSFWGAAIPTAFLFGLVHNGRGTASDILLLQISITAVGLGLAWLYERRGTLVSNVVAHATFNLITVAITVLHIAR